MQLSPQINNINQFSFNRKKPLNIPQPPNYIFGVSPPPPPFPVAELHYLSQAQPQYQTPEPVIEHKKSEIDNQKTHSNLNNPTTTDDEIDKNNNFDNYIPPPIVDDYLPSPRPIVKTPIIASHPPIEKTSVIDSPPPFEKTSIIDSPPPIVNTPIIDSHPPIEKTSVIDSPPPFIPSPINNYSNKANTSPPPEKSPTTDSPPMKNKSKKNFILPPIIQPKVKPYDAFDDL